MFRIRFHGRGGQGMKTASRILGMAFFKAGYQVQDAPCYGAERRGAPIFAYVRAIASALYGARNAPILASYIGGLGGRDISQQEFFAIADELHRHR